MEFKRFKRRIKVNSHSVNIEVVIKVENEDNQSILFDQDFETKVQESAYRAKVERGDLFAGFIVVVAHAEGLEGEDSLGACELRPNNMFNSDPFEQSVNSYLETYSMVKSATDQLKRNLENEYSRLILQAKRFKKYSKGVK